MATNPNLTYGKVTGFYSRVFVDGTDADAQPETMPISGLQITFTPSVQVLVNKTAKATIQITTFPATTDEDGNLCTMAGDVGIELPATIDPLINETGWTWTVTIAGPVGGYPREQYAFTLSSGQEVDLSTVVKLPSSIGTQIVQWEAAVAATQAYAADAEAAAASIDTAVAGKLDTTALPTEVLALDANAASALRVQQDARQAATIATATTAGAAGPSLLRAGHDREVSRGKTLVAYEDAREFVEDWADTGGWTGSPLPTVAAGVAYRPAASSKSQIDFPIGDAESFRLTATLVVPAGNSTVASLACVGLSTDTAGGGPPGGYANMIGVRTESRIPVIHYSNPRGTGVQENLGAALPAGTYNVTIVGDATSVCFTIADATRTLEYQKRVSRAGVGTITKIVSWLEDDRGVSGVGIGRIASRAAVTTAKNRTLFEGRGDWSARLTTRTALADNGLRIVVPDNYDPRRGAPLALYCHGATGPTGSETQPYSGAGKEWERALVDAGYVFLSAAGGSGLNFGGPDGMAEYLLAYKFARDNLHITGTVLIGESMGGLAALNLLGRQVIPGVAAFVGLYPISNLAWAYPLYGWTPTIKTIYGIASDGSDYAAKTAGYDPILRDPSLYLGTPMRFYHSPADPTVPKSLTDAFVAKVGPTVKESTVIVTSGGHGDASNFTAPMCLDLVAFLDRSLGR